MRTENVYTVETGLSRLRRPIGRALLILLLACQGSGCAALQRADPGRGFRVWAAVWAILAIVMIGADELSEESSR